VSTPVTIPLAPDALVLPIERLWNGAHCPTAGLSAEASVWLEPASGALVVRGAMPARRAERIPEAPPGARIANLWEYDVVEVFLAFRSPADAPRYLEIELGAGGHWLVLAFDGLRRRSNEHADLRPELAHRRAASGWESTLALAPELFAGQELVGLNAYAIAEGQHLAWSALDGPRPDFHQPSRFPPACLVAP
jgi:hypothetical protein